MKKLAEETVTPIPITAVVKVSNVPERAVAVKKPVPEIKVIKKITITQPTQVVKKVTVEKTV